MTEPSKPRLAIDLDDLERQLRRSAEQPAPKKDPLAELARIVGQDDPFRKLLGESDGSVSRGSRASDAPPPDLRPTLTPEDESVLHGHAGSYAGPAEPRSFDADHYSEPPYEPLEPLISGYAGPDEAEPAPRRSRKPLFMLAGILGVAVLGAAGLTMMRGGGARLSSGGEPPLVRADASPSKIAPQNPGGVEIPNQNKQIFERGPQDSQSRVVDRQEQPVDLQQAARNMPAPPPDPTQRATVPGGQGATNPGATAPGSPRTSAVTSALGEPRRVRTVSVKPDGSIDTPATSSTAGGPAPPAVPPPPSLPAAPPPVSSQTPSSSATPAQPSASAAPARPRPGPPAAPFSPAPNPGTTPSSSSQAESSRGTLADNPPLAFPQADTRPAPSRPSTQVAAVPPRPPAPEPSRPAPEPTRAAAPQPSSGGFSVQIGTRPTEAEARAAFEQFSTRFASVLGGRQPLIRKAEVNGRTVYRVRVGSSTRAEATELCVRLKAAGGECFVAAN